MKPSIGETEWYPVYSIDDWDFDSEHSPELTEELKQRYERVWEQWKSMQDELYYLFNKQEEEEKKHRPPPPPKPAFSHVDPCTYEEDWEKWKTIIRPTS